MTTIMDGKKLADKIFNKLKAKIEKESFAPTLAVILANDNKASEIYVNSKEKKALEIGIKSTVYKFNKSITQEKLITLIKELNTNPKVNAILVQLPLFEHLNSQEIIELIEPKKDVDGFHPINAGRLCSNLTPYAIPCTPKGIVRLLKEYKIDLTGKDTVVIGRSNIVGKPAAMLLSNENATVTIAHSKTKNLSELTKKADIIVSATGCPRLIKSDMVKQGAVIVDVGIVKQNDKKLIGDVDFKNVQKKASCITPVPGGVGPMTIACLMENTYELFKLQNK